MREAHFGGQILSVQVLSAAALVAALAIAVIGAIITGSEVGTATGTVESASAASGNFLGTLSDWLPLGYAFGAGMVASVNPCGFAMLPAYLGLYLGEQEKEDAQGRGMAGRLQRAVLVGLTVTVGFVLMFGIVGVPIGLGAQGLVGTFSWIGLIIGVLLVVAGAYVLSGGKLYNNLAVQLSSRVGGTDNKGIRSYFMFGLAYGIASLSCTLPIFLAVIGSSITADTFLDSLWQFLLYGLGMGSVILLLTIGMALFKSAFIGGLRKVLPYVGTISGVMLLLAGAFIVYYWLTIGGLLDKIQGAA